MIRDVGDIGPENEEQGFQFPGTFTITAMGSAEAGLEERVPRLLADIGLTVLHETVSTRASSQGNYLSVKVDFECPDRDKYNEAHAVLRADPDIRYTL